MQLFFWLKSQKLNEVGKAFTLSSDRKKNSTVFFDFFEWSVSLQKSSIESIDLIHTTACCVCVCVPYYCHRSSRETARRRANDLRPRYLLSPSQSPKTTTTTTTTKSGNMCTGGGADSLWSSHWIIGHKRSKNGKFDISHTFKTQLKYFFKRKS